MCRLCEEITKKNLGEIEKNLKINKKNKLRLKRERALASKILLQGQSKTVKLPDVRE